VQSGRYLVCLMYMYLRWTNQRLHLQSSHKY
jgi:hypothetical protein